MRLVAVFDTNILISAIVFGGNPERCVAMARSGAAEGLTCRGILDELADRLRIRFGFSHHDAVEVEADLLACLNLIAVAGRLAGATRDQDDDRVLECAGIGEATHLVTGDRRHLLPLGTYRGVRIVSAAEFLQVVVP